MSYNAWKKEWLYADIQAACDGTIKDIWSSLDELLFLNRVVNLGADYARAKDHDGFNPLYESTLFDNIRESAKNSFQSATSDQYSANKMMVYGMMLTKGFGGCTVDREEAKQMFSKAYELGNPHACYQLVFNCGERTPEYAMELLLCGARADDLQCILGLGHKYFYVERDFEKATIMFTRALFRGYNDGPATRELYRLLTDHPSIMRLRMPIFEKALTNVVTQDMWNILFWTIDTYDTTLLLNFSDNDGSTSEDTSSVLDKKKQNLKCYIESAYYN